MKLRAADLFCGAGGTSTGLLRACQDAGYELELLAINHWTVAIETHKLNHPYADHRCTSIDNIDPRKAVPSGRLNILVASPECTHHSNARGGRPMSDQSRASAWCILRWAEALYIENILVENVKEFRTWGPLGAKGRPIRRLRGALYLQFLESLRSLGYAVEERILNAADYGDPTTRERLFIMARRGGRQVSWPKPTHGAPEKMNDTKQGLMFGRRKLKPWVSARSIIDWDLPSKSIFNRPKPLAAKTLERIYAGLQKFGGPNAEPFLIVLRQHMGARSVSDPLPTLSAGGKHVALVQPEPFILNIDHHGGNGNQVRSIGRPLGTVTTKARSAVIEPVLVNMKGKSKARSIDSPMPTQTTKNHIYVAEPQAFLLSHPRPKEKSADSIDKPLRTVTASSSDFALVEPEAFILPHAMFKEGAPDSIERPLRTLVGKNARQVRVCEPILVPFFGERDGQEPRSHSLDKPLPAVTGHGAGALVEPFLVDINHGVKADECPKKEAQRRSQSIDRPLRTVTTNRGKGLVEPCIVKYNGTAKAQSVHDPLHTIATKERFALVTTEHGTYALDIRLRMLQLHELAAAMSFGKYQFTGKMEEKVKQVGNAVPVHLATALIAEMIQ